RGARAESIEESWYEWQEGNREICPDCKGTRLNPVARAVRLQIENGQLPIPNSTPAIDDFANLPVEQAAELFRRLKFKGREALIARDILPEIRERLKFLCEVGLGYLQLGRGVTTLSGGEGQRIRLAAQLGSNLSGVLYILDEPTIGLHARDNQQLLEALQKLKSRGNSVLVVEHDEETMRCADYIIDLGPGAGVHGGQLVAAGTLRELIRHPESITGKCLRSHKNYPTRGSRRAIVGQASRLSPRASRPRKVLSTGQAPDNAGSLLLRHATKNNLKDLLISFPLARLVLISGVSGSGKSTLIRECLVPAVTHALKSPSKMHSVRSTPDLTGFDAIQSVYEVDQAPIGRTPRSIPATYVGF